MEHNKITNMHWECQSLHHVEVGHYTKEKEDWFEPVDNLATSQPNTIQWWLHKEQWQGLRNSTLSHWPTDPVVCVRVLWIVEYIKITQRALKKKKTDSSLTTTWLCHNQHHSMVTTQGTSDRAYVIPCYRTDQLQNSFLLL